MNFFRNIFWYSLGVLLSFPLFSLAQSGGNNQPSGGNNFVTLNNPLTGVDDLGQLVIKILGIVVKIGAYVAVAAIIYSGFLFVKAQGNQKELEDAKKTFFYTIIGVMILLGAQAIALGVGNTIKLIAP